MKSPKHILEMDDITADELEGLIKKTHKIDNRINQRKEKQYFKDKRFVVLFELPSTRTKVSTILGIQAHGGILVDLDGKNVLWRSDGKEREAKPDVMRTIHQFADCFAARVVKHSTIVALADASEIPVISLLSDEEHPAQAVGDAANLANEFGNQFSDKKFGWVGDITNVAVSTSIALAKLGINEIVLAAPKKYWMPNAKWELLQRCAAESGTTVTQTDDKNEAAYKANALGTDTYVSMAFESENAQRLEDFKDWQVDEVLVGKAADKVVICHCLPAHDDQEISRGVLEAHAHQIFDGEAKMREASIVAMMDFAIKRSPDVKKRRRRR